MPDCSMPGAAITTQGPASERSRGAMDFTKRNFQGEAPAPTIAPSPPDEPPTMRSGS